MCNNLVVRLALLKDYDLVEELCKKDKFIQSPVTNLIMGLSHSVKDMTIHIVKTYVKYKVPVIL